MGLVESGVGVGVRVSGAEGGSAVSACGFDAGLRCAVLMRGFGVRFRCGGFGLPAGSVRRQLGMQAALGA
ncbi:hypothetical protein JCM4914_42930 [Streptomyces platensis subsp. malvinus]